MAYNLQPLIQLVEQILHPDGQQCQILDHITKSQLDSLLVRAISLRDAFEAYSPTSNKETQDLESKITEAAHKAEDIIESQATDQILTNPGRDRFINSHRVLQQVIIEFVTARHELMKIMGRIPDSSFPGNSFPPDPTSSRNLVVGLDADLICLKEQLIRLKPEVEVIPIVGMGGIGKTFLAQCLYNDSLINYHFDTRAWVTISQQYNLNGILLDLLRCINGHVTAEMHGMENFELTESLYRSLICKRYLIVLDDMWHTNVWDQLRRLFRDNRQGSRIILTTRELSVANYVKICTTEYHHMQLLDEAHSWRLLCSGVFQEEDCPPELKNIGENIASNCKGLPLAIHVIGGLLSKSNRTIEFWTRVANDISSAADEQDDEQFSRILSLSYDHLPHHLRPCFLYIAAFSEDSVIRASKLIRLLVAEGFTKPTGDKTSEEVVEVYLQDLVDRNLLVIQEQESNWKVKTFGIHDLLWDLCVKKAAQEKFLYVTKHMGDVFREYQYDSIRRARISLRKKPRIRKKNIFQRIFLQRSSTSVPLRSSEFTTTRYYVNNARSSLYIYGVPLFDSFNLADASRLLRELDVLDVELVELPKEIFQLVNLRYLAVKCNQGLTSEVSKLWKLQTLIWEVASPKEFLGIPSELWSLTQIRHIKLKNWWTSRNMRIQENKSHRSSHHLTFDLEKLQTLSSVIASHFTNFLEKVPKCDLSCLQKLETLKCSLDCISYSQFDTCHFLSGLSFPPSLKKFTLRGIKIPSGFMATIGSLPNLQVLKLQKCLMDKNNREWEPSAGEFKSLKYLLLEDLDLVYWRADETHFPMLEQLVIMGCSSLENIPSGIGDIVTLKIIELRDSIASAEDSARQIHWEQQSQGNFLLQVRIYGRIYGRKYNHYRGPSRSHPH